MKLLVVDVGNTSTAVGLWDRGRVSHVAHFDGGFEEAAKRAGEILTRRHRDTEGVGGLAYVSVVPKVDAKWRGFARKCGLKFLQVSHRQFSRKASPCLCASAFDLSLDYPEPSTIGADRLADAAGAVSRYGAPVLVMDFGTALTAAVVTEDRVWRGGVIAPGFPLMRDYLFERTAKLPRMELGKGRPPKIGRSTEEAMRFGALVGYRGMVREIVAQLKRNFGTDFKLVATGGFARWALRDLDLPFTVDPTLTLYGAGLIANGKWKMQEREGVVKKILTFLSFSILHFAFSILSGCGPFWVDPYITVRESSLNWVEIHYYNMNRDPIRRTGVTIYGNGLVLVKKGTSELVSNDFAKKYQSEDWENIRTARLQISSKDANDIFQNLVNFGVLDKEKTGKAAKDGKKATRFIAVKANLCNNTYSDNVNIFEEDPDLAEQLLDVVREFEGAAR